MKEGTVPPNVDFRAFCFSDKGMRQARIAERLGVSRALVNQWAKGIKVTKSRGGGCVAAAHRHRS